MCVRLIGIRDEPVIRNSRGPSRQSRRGSQRSGLPNGCEPQRLAGALTLRAPDARLGGPTRRVVVSAVCPSAPPWGARGAREPAEQPSPQTLKRNVSCGAWARTPTTRWPSDLPKHHWGALARVEPVRGCCWSPPINPQVKERAANAARGVGTPNRTDTRWHGRAASCLRARATSLVRAERGSTLPVMAPFCVKTGGGAF